MRAFGEIDRESILAFRTIPFLAVDEDDGIAGLDAQRERAEFALGIAWVRPLGLRIVRIWTRRALAGRALGLAFGSGVGRGGAGSPGASGCISYWTFSVAPRRKRTFSRIG